MNTGITLIDVRNEAMETIKMLKSDKMDVKKALEIRNLLGTIIDTAKVQVEFLKTIPNSMKEQMGQDGIKAIAGTLQDRDADLDKTLADIKKSENTWKQSS